MSDPVCLFLFCSNWLRFCPAYRLTSAPRTGWFPWGKVLSPTLPASEPDSRFSWTLASPDRPVGWGSDTLFWPRAAACESVPVLQNFGQRPELAPLSLSLCANDFYLVPSFGSSHDAIIFCYTQERSSTNHDATKNSFFLKSIVPAYLSKRVSKELYIQGST